MFKGNPITPQLTIVSALVMVLENTPIWLNIKNGILAVCILIDLVNIVSCAKTMFGSVAPSNNTNIITFLVFSGL